MCYKKLSIFGSVDRHQRNFFIVSNSYVNQYQKLIFKNKKISEPKSRSIRPKSKPIVVLPLPWWSSHPRRHRAEGARHRLTDVMR
jgi:hypothetical protein